jgi:hypothetical protein
MRLWVSQAASAADEFGPDQRVRCQTLPKHQRPRSRAYLLSLNVRTPGLAFQGRVRQPADGFRGAGREKKPQLGMLSAAPSRSRLCELS